MAQIVCIDTGTVRTGQEIGDIVSIHDDKVELTGPGYDGFRILRVPGTAEEVKAELDKKIPKRTRCFKLSVANTWTEEQPAEADFWQDGTEWKRIVEEPKFALNIKDLESAETTLADTKLTSAEKVASVSQLTVSKVATDAKNQTVITIKTSATKIG